MKPLKIACSSLAYRSIFPSAGHGILNISCTSRFDRIRHVIQLLTGEREYKIGEIAAECGMSVALLFQIFRKEMGCSPREYREQFFLRQGKKMLLNTDLSLENIAEACHMCDRYYFSNRFKRLFGVSPAAFRKGISR